MLYQRIALVVGAKFKIPSKLKQALLGLPNTILFTRSAAAEFGCEPHSPAQLEEADLVVSFGGDGTFLAAVRAFNEGTATFIGVRLSEGLGFLTEFSSQEFLKNLTKILQGQFRFSNRILLTALVQRKQKTYQKFTALNEITITQKYLPELTKITFTTQEEKIADFYADGVIVATPTGSTAYSLSAGGPLLFPTLHNLVLTPIAPHLLSSRPLVLPEDCTLKTEITTEGLVLRADGQQSCILHKNDQLKFQIATYKIQIGCNQDYFSLLRQKLNWAAR